MKTETNHADVPLHPDVAIDFADRDARLEWLMQVRSAVHAIGVAHGELFLRVDPLVERDFVHAIGAAHGKLRGLLAAGGVDPDADARPLMHSGSVCQKEQVSVSGRNSAETSAGLVPTHGYATDIDALRAIVSLYSEALIEAKLADARASLADPEGTALSAYDARKRVRVLESESSHLSELWARTEARRQYEAAKRPPRDLEGALTLAPRLDELEKNWPALVADVRARLAGQWDRPLPNGATGIPLASGDRSKEGQDAYGRYADIAIAGVVQRFRWIPPSTFTMGSHPLESGRWDDEGPQREVTLSRGYWMADTPVTQELYEAVMGESANSNRSRFRGPRRPVEMVSWEDVRAERVGFLSRLNALVPGLDARLPTEAEWEHACRVGSTGPRYGELDEVAWHYGNSSNSTQPVKGKAPNAWGLYDMLGNVYEWVEDRLGPYSEGAVTDPRGPSGGSSRVVRGGSWFSNARHVRAAYRDGNAPGGRRDFVGFRLARGQQV